MQLFQDKGPSTQGAGTGSADMTRLRSETLSKRVIFLILKADFQRSFLQHPVLCQNQMFVIDFLKDIQFSLSTYCLNSVMKLTHDILYCETPMISVCAK